MTSRLIPLHEDHLALGAKTTDFGGWLMPVEYSGTVAEHTAVRTSVGVFDVSHMGTARITGQGTVDAMNRLLVSDLRKIGSGQAQYSLLCTESGGVIDDLIAYVISDDEMLIVPNASNSDAVLATLRSHLPSSIAVTDLREQRVMLAVQGPGSASVVEALGLPSAHDYMSFVSVPDHRWSRAGAAFDHVVVCRTGYTGEHGYEILVPVDAAHDALREVVAAGALPCGLGARDTLRLEMGYPLHGHELSAQITPVQARVGWAIGWAKDQFLGRDALLAEKAAGPSRTLRGLVAQDRGIPRADMTVLEGNREVGITTSGSFSPTLQQGIALALLSPDVAEGATVSVDVRGRRLACTVTKPPFVTASAK